MAEQEVTAVLSNMSVVKMPEDYAQYIEKFGVYTSTNRTELCICSFSRYVITWLYIEIRQHEYPAEFLPDIERTGASVKVAEPDFPEDARPNYEGKKVLQIFTFCCIAAIVISMMTDIIISPGVHWSVFVAAGCATMWLTMAVGYVKRFNLLKNAAWQLLIMSGICVLWDLGTGWRGLVCEYRNSGYLPADPGCNVDHIKNTFPVTERIYDLLCDGRCLFDDSSIDSFSDRSNPLQDSIGYLYRVQFSAVDRINFIQTKRI